VNWPVELEKELARAREARLRGNEGQARVCARRAAGIAVRMYLHQHGVHTVSTNVVDLLNRMLDDPGIDENIKRQIRLLTLRVDTEFELPSGVDLIAEAQTLCRQLLK